MREMSLKVGGATVDELRASTQRALEEIRLALRALDNGARSLDGQVAVDRRQFTGNVTNVVNSAVPGFVTLDGAETVTNKSLVDASTHIIDDVDPTKRIEFQASVLTPGATRVVTVPDSDLVIAGSNRIESISQPWTFENDVTLNADIFGARAYYTGARTGSFSSSFNLFVDGSEMIGTIGLGIPLPHPGTIIAAAASVYVAFVSHDGTLQLDVAINDTVLFSAVKTITVGGLRTWLEVASRATSVSNGAVFYAGDCLRMTIAYGNGFVGNVGRTFTNVGVVFDT